MRHHLAGRRFFAYTLRRVPSAGDAADVVAETYTIAWRGLEQIPVGDAALLWLHGVAENVVAMMPQVVNGVHNSRSRSHIKCQR
ncbi:sigma factor [Ferrimicrobium sp.]|uniref:sigma factor n=1 Tax=Ferrimicrobium sp. TaxID=2926050 RepID=UPI002639357C|nr:sigma factor [Ferrimicrobium sp.]